MRGSRKFCQRGSTFDMFFFFFFFFFFLGGGVVGWADEGRTEDPYNTKCGSSSAHL